MKHFFYYLYFFLFLLFVNSVDAQNIRFSFEKTLTSGTTTEVRIYAEVTSGTENLTGYTIHLYYDDTETSVTSFDSSPTTSTLGWTAVNQTNIDFQADNNANIGITHTGYFFYQNFDNSFSGDDMSTTPTHLLTIYFDHTIGTTASGAVWLAETDEVPAIQYVDNIFTGYDIISTGTQSQLLPVELISFTGRKKDDKTVLEWETTSERNNKGFYVQRSTNFDTWETLGFVEGHGTSVINYQYRYVDKDPKPGLNYYRLKQIDVDGKTEYSNVVVIEHHFSGSASAVKIYPNPARNSLYFIVTEEAYFIDVYDQSGRLLMSTQNANELDISKLNEGLYLVNIRTDNGILKTEKVIIQR